MSAPRQVGSIYEHFCKKYNIYGWLSPWPAYAANRVKVASLASGVGWGVGWANGESRITSARNEQCDYITHISNVRTLCVEQYVSLNFATLKEHLPPGTLRRGPARLTTLKKRNLFKGGESQSTARFSTLPI